MQKASDHVGVPFYNFLLQTHSDVNDVILDPFCGSGQMGVAAVINDRRFVGVEYNADRARTAELAMQEMDSYINR
jgi:DNA modification methylase